MLKKLSFFTIAALVMFSTSALADTITGSGTFQSWTANDDGSPFWDNGSWDGEKKNVGYYLSNTGAFTGGGGPGAIEFYGQGTNAASFSFNKTGASDLAALKIEIAGNAGVNQFGWYDLAHPSTLNVIFNGPATGGASATFIPSAHYGFYFTTKDDGTFRTDGTGSNQFALFQEIPGVYWLGMEDLLLCHSDKDYNDMIVIVSSFDSDNSVPEPGTLLLLGLGLIGVAGMRKKFQK
jgi:hypothetical protein